jgi:lipoprotein-anchoring transpeptidase ErfK/SrfK
VRPRALLLASLAASGAVGLAASLGSCGGPSGQPLAAQPYDAAHQLVLSSQTDDSRKAKPGKPLVITAKEGRIADVTVTDAAGGHLRGSLAPDGSRWRSEQPLSGGNHYTVRVSTEKGSGAPGRTTTDFDTAAVTGKRLRVTFGPDSGTYGVGQPVTATLSAPVRSRAARAVVERGLLVSSRPAVQGAWHWVDDRTLHYRPREYWPAHALIEVRSALDGVTVRQGLHGAPSKPVTLRTGDRVVAFTNAATHRMTVQRNGRTIRTIPITTGMPGFETRTGTKVILAKEASVRMSNSTVGIAEFYDLQVYWAARVTWSGEYVHAAPWSVGSHGVANVSHGCTGMSTEAAHWFFDTVRVGDVVKVVGSGGEAMTPFDNGFGDWNLSWEAWQKGSALHGGATPDRGTDVQAARLRPQV